MSTIYSLWLQGYDDAPDQVKTCLDRWNKLNPAYKFELLDLSDVQDHIKTLPLKISNITPQSLSDIVRVAILHKTGGIWVDATVFPTKSLSEWLEETVGDSEFFSYKREAQQKSPKDRPFSAWFLYATNKSKIIEKLWEETCRYWSIGHIPMTDQNKETYHEDPIAFMGLSQEVPNSPYPYHWLQHIFSYLEKTDASFAEIWHSCPDKSITIPHQIQFLAREELVNENTAGYLTEERIKSIVENSEMQKLNWRMEFPIDIMEKYSVRIPNDIHGESFGPKFL
ncbi:MAG: hypothetical protein KBD73_03095 [Candidatus Magasanikbacteria bacterium]|nr:hypothetical protein [Candidatus Magasanikbacteria bacterium]